jgi:benzodiazapine receptor
MTEKKDYLLFQVLNVITVISVVTINILSSAFPLFGVNQGQISDAYPNFFTPAGYVFSIWFIIYLQSIIFMIYQARRSQRTEDYLGKIGFFYFLGGLANIAWIIVFPFSYAFMVANPPFFLASVVLLLLLFLMLLIAYLRLGVGVDPVPRNEKLAVHLHFSVYLGWISVATIAATASALNILVPGIPDATQHLATAAMLFVALVLTLIVVYRRRDCGYALVILWAAAGIGVKWLTIPIILYSVIAVAVILIIGMILIPYLKKANLLEYYKGPK